MVGFSVTCIPRTVGQMKLSRQPCRLMNGVWKSCRAGEELREMKTIQ